MDNIQSFPLISVIVAIYNEENYIKKCINSIINQTYKHLEIILVDDGSTDSSGKICDIYAKEDKRVKVIHKKNGGAVSARKAGISIAKGYYAALVDGDDWIETDMYEKLVEQIRDADLIVSGIIRSYTNHSIYERNKITDGIYEGTELEEQVFQKMIYTGKFFERGLLPHLYKSLYKREILLKNQLLVSEDIRLGDEMTCFYPAVLDSNKIVITSDCFYHYRMREGSLMSINDGDDLWRFKIVYKYLQNRFSEKENVNDSLMDQLDYLMIYCLLLKEFHVLQSDDGLFPYSNIEDGKKIVVYGAGRFGNSLVKYIKSKQKYSLVAWVDESGKPNNIHILNNLEFDYIIIGVLLEEIADTIEKNLSNLGIPDYKIKKIDIKSIEIIKANIRKILD